MIYGGAKTGLEGIGGSGLASAVLTGKEGREGIQKGDPYLERLLLEASDELASTGYLEGEQDMGAAGILCSTTEVVHRGQKKTGRQLGAKIYTNRIPTKVAGMTTRELLISESQERMMFVGKREFRDKIAEVFKKWDLEFAVVGDVTEDGNYTLLTEEDGHERVLARMTIEEICGDIYQDWPLGRWKTQGSEHRKASRATTDRIWRQYDWRVGARTIKGPNQPGHFAILDIEEIGKELVVAWSSDEGRSDEDPILGINYAFDKAYGYLRSYNATPLGLTNCMNFGNPPDSMGAFEQIILGLDKRCREFEVPVVSGNVSLYNAGNESSIKPTPVLVMVGLKDKS